MNTSKRTEPWYATEEILKRYLLRAKPYLKGRMLDAGCGASRYKDLFDYHEYVGLEFSENFKPTVVGDLRDMPFGDCAFDSILNNQVLEQIDDTHAVRPGGYLCITAPFISRTHGVPHDYWRFSEYGMRYLFERHGFAEIDIVNMGGFLTTQAYL